MELVHLIASERVGGLLSRRGTGATEDWRFNSETNGLPCN